MISVNGGALDEFGLIAVLSGAVLAVVTMSHITTHHRFFSRLLSFGVILLAAAALICFAGCKKEKKTSKKKQKQAAAKSTPTPAPTPAPTAAPVIPPGSVYFLSNPDGINTVEAFSRNSTTGFITYLGSFASGGNGTTEIQGSQAHAVVANGAFLYAVNSGSGSFSTFRIGSDGRPSLLATTSSGGTRPVSIAVHGNLLFVLNQGIPTDDGGPLAAGLAGFVIDANGIPVTIDDPKATYNFSPDDMPSDVFFTGNGQRLAVLRSGANAVSSFDVAADGFLTNPRSIDVGSQPVGGASTAVLPWTGFAAVVEDPGAASVVSFLTQTALSIVSQVPADVDRDPCWAATSADGRRLWTSNFLPKSLTLYSIGSDSTLAREGLYEPAIEDGPGSLDLDVSADGRFLYRLRAFNIGSNAPDDQPPPIVEVFEIKSDNDKGGLRLIQSVVVPIVAPKDAAPTGMAVATPQ